MTKSTAANVTSLDGFRAVRAMIADRQPVPMVRLKKSPSPDIPRDGEEAGKWTPDALGLPNSCPVTPLGIRESVAYFLDPIGQVQMLAPPYGKGHLLGLFGGDDHFLSWAWPRYKAGGAIDGYAAEKAAAALLQACAAKGPWDSVEAVRGRGCWLGRDGKIILHRGTKVRVGKADLPPGEIDGHIYPTRPRLDGPWPEAPGINPAVALRPLLQSWAWARPDVDPTLLLGWLGAAFVGGALAWRPTVYLTGDAATGKSTLQELVKGILGGYLLQAVDTTAAGLYQHIGTDAVPIAVDEFEGKSDTRSAEKVLELARASCSGGLMLRGGDRHNPVEFRARSSFLFSSINTPPLRPQDLSRMAVLRLHTLAKPNTAAEVEAVADLRRSMDSDTLGVIGRCILHRMLDQWPRFAETLQHFKIALAAGGMDSRGQDTFGTLLACADLIEYDGWSDDRLWTSTREGDVQAWSALMRVDLMAEFEDRAANWRKCLSHMLGVRVDAWRGGNRAVVGQLLEDFFKGREGATDSKGVKTALGQAGLGLVHRERAGIAFDWWLAVPNQSPLVRELFQGSDWGGAIGASVWAGALRQSPRGDIHDVAKARVNGDVTPCTLISLSGLYGETGIMRLAGEGKVD